MIKCTCLEKVRDSRNNIIGYHLQDGNGVVASLTASELKDAIRKGQIQVVNLTLTSDGRLVDGAKIIEKSVNDSEWRSRTGVDVSDRLQEMAEKAATQAPVDMLTKSQLIAAFEMAAGGAAKLCDSNIEAREHGVVGTIWTDNQLNDCFIIADDKEQIVILTNSKKVKLEQFSRNELTATGVRSRLLNLGLWCKTNNINKVYEPLSKVMEQLGCDIPAAVELSKTLGDVETAPAVEEQLGKVFGVGLDAVAGMKTPRQIHDGLKVTIYGIYSIDPALKDYAAVKVNGNVLTGIVSRSQFMGEVVNLASLLLDIVNQRTKVKKGARDGIYVGQPVAGITTIVIDENSNVNGDVWKELGGRGGSLKVVGKAPEGTKFSGWKAGALDLSGLDTSGMTNMDCMFYESRAILLDVSNFDVSNVTTMRQMFDCTSAEALDLTKWDTSKVEDVTWMFGNSRIGELDLRNFNLANVRECRGMFINSAAEHIQWTCPVLRGILERAGRLEE